MLFCILIQQASNSVFVIFLFKQAQITQLTLSKATSALIALENLQECKDLLALYTLEQ